MLTEPCFVRQVVLCKHVLKSVDKRHVKKEKHLQVCGHGHGLQNEWVVSTLDTTAAVFYREPQMKHPPPYLLHTALQHLKDERGALLRLSHKRCPFVAHAVGSFQVCTRLIDRPTMLRLLSSCTAVICRWAWGSEQKRTHKLRCQMWSRHI